MRNEKKYAGVITPLLTPSRSNGDIDEQGVEKLLQFTMEPGTYPFILGTTGEVAHNSYNNREHLVKTVAGIVDKKMTLYAGIPDNCIEHSISSAKKYYDLGVDVMVIHLPFFLPLTSELMYRYFMELADNSPAPLILYNIKAITGMSIPVDIIEKLSDHQNIVGLKDSERDWERMNKLAEIFNDRDDFSLFIGWTGKSSEALHIGFDGIVPNTANLVPNLFQNLYESVLAGDMNTAAGLQAKADELGQLVQANKTMARTIPELKAILEHLGICERNVLKPLERLTDEYAQLIINRFNELDLRPE